MEWNLTQDIRSKKYKRLLEYVSYYSQVKLHV